MELILEIGTKIKIGDKYAEENGWGKGETIELIEGSFDEDNGLYCYTSNVPAIWNENQDEFDSIYHLFGNQLEGFMDCEIIYTQPMKPTNKEH